MSRVGIMLQLAGFRVLRLPVLQEYEFTKKMKFFPLELEEPCCAMSA